MTSFYKYCVLVALFLTPLTHRIIDVPIVSSVTKNTMLEHLKELNPMPVKYIEPEEIIEEDEEDLTDYVFEAFVQTTFEIETGNGKHPKWTQNFNPGGIRCWSSKRDSDGYCIYESKEDGMNALRTLLYDNYYSVYGDDFKTIREIYCQCGPKDYPQFMNRYNIVLERLTND